MTEHPRTGMSQHFGIRTVTADKEKVVGEIEADDRHVNGRGIVHGGAMMAFADELGGLAASFHLEPGTRTTTIESKTNFLRACLPGRVVGETVPLHTGRRSIVVQTSIFGPDGKRAAIVTQTQLVLPKADKPKPA
jgi:1,4-dihydroxy-2-naphthoyl-CoA hydrolase